MNLIDCKLYVFLEMTSTDSKYFIQKERSMLDNNRYTTKLTHTCVVRMTNGSRL